MTRLKALEIFNHDFTIVVNSEYTEQECREAVEEAGKALRLTVKSEIQAEQFREANGCSNGDKLIDTLNAISLVSKKLADHYERGNTIDG